MNDLKYGRKSKEQLATIDPRLKAVFAVALATEYIDITIIQGRRSKEEQNLFFSEGKSRVRWPNGKHNVLNPDDLARAVDAAPYINGKASFNQMHCVFLAGIVLTIAKMMDIRIRWGGNWDMDREPITDQDFQDLVHYELVD